MPGSKLISPSCMLTRMLVFDLQVVSSSVDTLVHAVKRLAGKQMMSQRCYVRRDMHEPDPTRCRLPVARFRIARRHINTHCLGVHGPESASLVELLQRLGTTSCSARRGRR